MTQLNLNLPYVVDNDDRKDVRFQTNSMISISMFRTAANATKAGKEGHKTRLATGVASRVVNKITNAKNTGAESINFDPDELTHIRESMTGWLAAGVVEGLSPWYELLTDEVERCTKQAQSDVKAAAIVEAEKAANAK